MKKSGIIIGIIMVLVEIGVVFSAIFYKVDIDEAEANGSKVIFRYEQAQCDKHSYINIKKCVYDAEGLHVYMSSPQISEKDIPAIRCYDKEYYLMDCEWEFSFEKDHFTISGADSYKIRGFQIGLTYVRELASKQFKTLEYTSSTNGPLLVSGDPYTFYTERELEEMKQEEMEYFNAHTSAEGYELMGTWVSVDDPNINIFFGYDEEKGKHYFQYTEISKNNDGTEVYQTYKNTWLFAGYSRSDPGIIFLAYGKRHHGRDARISFSNDWSQFTWTLVPGVTYVKQ